MHSFYDRTRDHFALGVVAVEVQTGEYSEQQLMQEFPVVERTDLLKDCGADFECFWLHPDCLTHEARHNGLDALDMGAGKVRELADDSDQERGLGWNQVLHLFGPVGRVDNRAAKNLIVLL